MHWIDYSIIAALVLGLVAVGLHSRRYVKGVAGFLAADRCAGRYLLTLADGMAALSAIGIIATFQQQYQAGFGANWWGGMNGPIYLFLTLSGFIAYRFRETRAMTMAQFFEMRYSRRFRIFAGILAWVSGILNYGVFPAVTARFLIYFCDIPRLEFNAGPMTVDVTLGIVMGLMLLTAVSITLWGGQIAIAITDFIQAQFVNVVLLGLLFLMFFIFGWGEIVGTLKDTAPKGQSLLNPFDQADLPDFNIFFYLIGAFNAIYSYMVWQGNQGFNCSAKTPHEAKMAKVLSSWRYGATWATISLLPICAYVFMHHPSHAEASAAVTQMVQSVADEGARKELTVPLALKQFLPVGVLGLFAAAMIAAATSTDTAYLHSWGSIFVQDVLLPFRRRELQPAEHLRWLRRSIVGVAVFSWVFGMVFTLQEFIFMYWAITGAIFVGGAGSVIIGGFYWKRGTTAGAWAGMITGSVLGFVGVLLNNIVWPKLLPPVKLAYPDVRWLNALPEKFWFDGMQLFFFTSCLSVLAYVGFSLATRPAPGFDMDRILHRGRFAVKTDRLTVGKKPGIVARLLGIDSEYTRGDRIIAWSVFIWSMYQFGAFVVGTALGLMFHTTDDGWAKWWLFSMVLSGIVGVVTVAWFLWCGFRDMGDMYATLRRNQEDALDDGTVRNGLALGQPESAAERSIV